MEIRKIEIAPSLLSANFLELKSEIAMINNSIANYIHLDIMDGVFVPNISFGMSIIKQIRKATNKILDTHLMIIQPERYIQEFKEAGVDILTVQYEACLHLHRTIETIKKTGMKAGVAINPHTNISLLDEILPYIDLVLIMSVNPGFGGQSFIFSSLNKIKRMREKIEKINPNVKIEVDGGVNIENYTSIISAGADILVAGNAIFSTKEPIKTITKLSQF